MIRATDHTVQIRSIYRRRDGGGTYHWFEAGDPDGELVVMIHGFMAHAMTFRRVVHLADEGYRLVMPDLPAHGRDQTFRSSDVEPTVASLRGWLRGFVDRLDTSFHVVGHSLGATLSYYLALETADRMHSLTLVNPGLRVPESRISQLLVDLIPPSLATLGATRLGMMLYEPIQWRGVRMTAEEVESYLEPLRQRDRLAFMLRLGSDLMRTSDRTSELQPLSLPTLLMWGEGDHILPVSDAPQIHALLGSSTELLIVDESGHSPMEDCPDAFVSAFLAFLDRVATRLSA